MLIDKWKTNRVKRPRPAVILEECLVNYLWYRTGIRSLFRQGLLNVGNHKTDEQTIKFNLNKYAFDRLHFFLPYFQSLPKKQNSILEIGPGGLLAQGILYNALGFKYSALDAFDGKVFSEAGKAHFKYLQDHWKELTLSSEAKWNGQFLKESNFPGIDNLNYLILSLEKANPKNTGGPFDSVFSYGVFEHLNNPKVAIDHCANLVKPNGTMIHRIDFFPHDFWSAYSNPLEFLTIPKYWYELMYDGRGAPNRFRYSWFKNEFETNGFKVEVKDLEYYPKDILTIRDRIDKSIAVKSDEDLLVCSATFVCQKFSNS
jgi:SAM-dependent methyltransferase